MLVFSTFQLGIMIEASRLAFSVILWHRIYLQLVMGTAGCSFQQPPECSDILAMAATKHGCGCGCKLLSHRHRWS